jgi:predicted N-acetyltransferase YhbS
LKTAPPVIRGERPDDVEGIERLLRRAFENHPHSQQTEYLIVARLRAAGFDAILQRCGTRRRSLLQPGVLSDLLMSSER